MKMRKKLLLFALCAVLLLSACGRKGEKPPSGGESRDPDQEYPVSIGESVRLSEKPQTVVSLSPAATELIYALGYEDQLVGVSNYCDTPEQAASLTKCGTPQGINFEALQSLAPKLVVSFSPLIESELVKLQQQEIEVLILERAGDLGGLKKNYTDLARAMNGEITGKQAGNELYQSFESFLSDMESQGKAVITGGKAKQSVIMLRLADYIMATGDTFEQKLLDKLMLDNLAAPYGDWVFPKDKTEELTPDYIISDSAITIPVLEKNAVYKKTQAVVKDRVVTIDFNAFERQTPRMKDEIAKIMDAIYPAS